MQRSACSDAKSAHLKPHAANSRCAAGVKQYCTNASAAARASGGFLSRFLSMSATGNSTYAVHQSHSAHACTHYALVMN